MKRNTEFLKLWGGQAVSEFGNQITGTAIPLLAVLTLGATPVEMGLLSALQSAPVLLFGLAAGVWVDRLRRRPVMIFADLARALLLGLIPLAAVLGLLHITQLYLIAALVGVMGIFFSSAYRAYVPTLVERENLVKANSRLTLSASVAEVVGPGLAGALVQAITAPFAILFDALSFVVSAFSIATIRKPEPALAQPEERQSLWQEGKEGLGFVLRQPILRALAGSSATRAFFGSFFGVLYTLYGIRELGLSPVQVGVTVGAGGAAALLGALFADRFAHRLSLNVTLIGGMLIAITFNVFILLAGSFLWLAFPLMILGQLGDFTNSIFDINELSLRQSVTPDRMLGRINASMELLVMGLMPVGAIAGGFLADAIGIQATLGVAVAGFFLSTLFLIFSPIRRLKTFPNPAEPQIKGQNA